MIDRHTYIWYTVLASLMALNLVSSAGVYACASHKAAEQEAFAQKQEALMKETVTLRLTAVAGRTMTEIVSEASPALLPNGRYKLRGEAITSGRAVRQSWESTEFDIID